MPSLRNSPGPAAAPDEIKSTGVGGRAPEVGTKAQTERDKAKEGEQNLEGSLQARKKPLYYCICEYKRSLFKSEGMAYS